MLVLTQGSPPLTATVLDAVDSARVRVSEGLDRDRRASLGQFLTPSAVARHLATLFPPIAGDVRILDPGAGIGSLGAALVARLLAEEQLPTSIHLTSYELDGAMHPVLGQTMEALAAACQESGVDFSADLRREDFLVAGVNQLANELGAPEAELFDAVVVNPPYRKIHTNSVERQLCRRIGLETSNLYTAFLAVAAGLLHPGGEMVAIVPRSFANGTYFVPFRHYFTSTVAFHHVHVYDARNRAFSDDAVLQENVIFRARKTQHPPETVTITSSTDPSDQHPSYREVPYADLIRPHDANRVIHIVPDEANQRIADRVASLAAELSDLGITVSTGRVVDFRARDYLRAHAEDATVPLIYPGHLREGRVAWPMHASKKPNALLNAPQSAGLLVPEGLYVLTKRFSAKEERRRIVAAIYDPSDVVPGPVGFENHLNYFHTTGHGLSRHLALGLRAYLNSTLVDLFFRQFSGHTQVNAGDLRSLRYPSHEQLCELGSRVGEATYTQHELDLIIDDTLFGRASGQGDPVRVRHRVHEAMDVLRVLGLPRTEIHERCALTLLALLALGPDDPWARASRALHSVTALPDFILAHYGKFFRSAPDEASRSQCVDQLLKHGVITGHRPARAKSPSPSPLYRITPDVVETCRAYDVRQAHKKGRTHLIGRVIPALPTR